MRLAWIILIMSVFQMISAIILCRAAYSVLLCDPHITEREFMIGVQALIIFISALVLIRANTTQGSDR